MQVRPKETPDDNDEGSSNEIDTDAIERLMVSALGQIHIRNSVLGHYSSASEEALR